MLLELLPRWYGDELMHWFSLLYAKPYTVVYIFERKIAALIRTYAGNRTSRMLKRIMLRVLRLLSPVCRRVIPVESAELLLLSISFRPDILNYENTVAGSMWFYSTWAQKVDVEESPWFYKKRCASARQWKASLSNQILWINHPFRGLRIYMVDANGYKGSRWRISIWYGPLITCEAHIFSRENATLYSE